MQSIPRNFTEVGKLGKTFGLDGYIRLNIEDAHFEALSATIEAGKAVFIGLDGFRIPFFVKKFDQEKELVQFRKTTGDQLDELPGKFIYLPADDVTDPAPVTDDLSVFVGYSVIDSESLQVLGRIDRIETYPAHPMAFIHEGDKELMIPMVADWIVDIDQEGRNLYMKLPQGIDHINED